jgi:hypothetical protein
MNRMQLPNLVISQHDNPATLGQSDRNSFSGHLTATHAPWRTLLGTRFLFSLDLPTKKPSRFSVFVDIISTCNLISWFARLPTSLALETHLREFRISLEISDILTISIEINVARLENSP